MPNRSVSISKEFAEIIDEHQISPTEIFRMGMGVYLCNIGYKGYTTKTNIERLRKLKNTKEWRNMNENFEKIQSLIKSME